MQKKSKDVAVPAPSAGGEGGVGVGEGRRWAVGAPRPGNTCRPGSQAHVSFEGILRLIGCGKRSPAQPA